MSLRDQLLKKGLASKQQAKKAARAARKKEHQQNTAKKANPTEVPQDEIKLKIAKEKAERKEQDRLLNLENKKMQESLQAAQIVITNGQLENPTGRVAYYFRSGETHIESVYVSPKQQSLLSEGKIGIATLLDDRFYLLGREDCLKLKTLRPDMLVCFHS